MHVSFTGVGGQLLVMVQVIYLLENYLFSRLWVLSIVPATKEIEEMEENRTWILSSGRCQSRREIFLLCNYLYICNRYDFT